MIRRLRSVFRDDDGDWTLPDGRGGELLALAAAVPLLASYAALSIGTDPLTTQWLAAVAGGLCGVFYTRRHRAKVLEHVPSGTNLATTVVLGGGFFLTLLDIVRLTASMTAFALAASATVLGVYVLRLASPLHEGLEPLARGVEPPDRISSPTGSDSS